MFFNLYADKESTISGKQWRQCEWIGCTYFDDITFTIFDTSYQNWNGRHRANVGRGLRFWANLLLRGTRYDLIIAELTVQYQGDAFPIVWHRAASPMRAARAQKLDDLITRYEAPLEPLYFDSHQCHFGAIDAVEVAMQPSYCLGMVTWFVACNWFPCPILDHSLPSRRWPASHS